MLCLVYKTLAPNLRKGIRTVRKTSHVHVRYVENLAWNIVCYTDSTALPSILGDATLQSSWRNVYRVWLEDMINHCIVSTWHDVPPVIASSIAIAMCQTFLIEHVTRRK